MDFTSKEVLSMLVLGLVVLLSTVSAQQPVQPAAASNNDDPAVVNPDGNELDKTTIKTSTILTDIPSSRPTTKTTERPYLSTTTRATPKDPGTTAPSTKNYNQLFTTKKPVKTGEDWEGSGSGYYDSEDNDGKARGSACSIRYRLGLTVASVATLFSIFYLR